MHRRRWITSIYIKSHIQSSSYVPLIIQDVLYKRFIPILQHASDTDESLDILPLNLSYSLDFVSAFIFGLPYGTNFIQDVSSRDEWLHYYLQSHNERNLYWLQEHPILTKTLARFGFRLVPAWADSAQHWAEDWVLKIVDRIEADRNMGAPDAEAGCVAATAYAQFKASIQSEQRAGKAETIGLNEAGMRLQLASECLDHLCMHQFFSSAFCAY